MWRRKGGKWVPRTQHGSEARFDAHRASVLRYLNTEEGGGKSCFLPEPWLTLWERWLKPTGAWCLLPTSEASTEECASGTEQQTQQTAVANELFGFRCPSGEGNWLVAILERPTELKTQSRCRLAPCSGSQSQSVAELSSSRHEVKGPSSSWQEVHGVLQAEQSYCEKNSMV